MRESGWWVDHAAHELHHGESFFPCDRDVEAFALWSGHALLLSSDTDCLSLWDEEGLVRTARVGVYPQDMAVWDGQAVICGGADGLLHMIDLPGLQHHGTLPLPGMPERIAIRGSTAHVLTLLTEPEVHTSLLSIPLPSGPVYATLTLPGIPGAIATDAAGIWVGVSEKVVHLPDGSPGPDIVVDGIELPESIHIQPNGIIVTDSLTERSVWIHC